MEQNALTALFKEAAVIIWSDVYPNLARKSFSFAELTFKMVELLSINSAFDNDHEGDKQWFLIYG